MPSIAMPRNSCGWFEGVDDCMTHIKHPRARKHELRPKPIDGIVFQAQATYLLTLNKSDSWLAKHFIVKRHSASNAAQLRAVCAVPYSGKMI